MSILTRISQIFNSSARYWWNPSINSFDGSTDYLTGYASDASFSDDNLDYSIKSNNNSTLTGPISLGDQTVPGTDAATGVSFVNSYDALPLSDSTSAAIFTRSTSTNFDSNDKTSLQFVSFDDAGNQIDNKTLRLGGRNGVKDLYALGEASLADAGNSFVVAYSTYNPANGKSSIDYTEFDDAGNAIKNGVLHRFTDHSHHGLDFGTFYASDNPNSGGTPDYMEMNRVAGSSSHVQAALYDTSMNLLEKTTVQVTGPNGETPTSIDKYRFLAPGAGPADNYGVLQETFSYQDGSGQSHEEFEIQTIDPNTLQVLAQTWFPDNKGSQSYLQMEHLNNGNIIGIYNDGGRSYVKEFNSDLQQVGKTFALPNDNYGYDHLSALGNDDFRIDWRSTSGTPGLTVKHTAIFHA